MRIGIRHFTVLSIILFIGDLQGQELKHMQIVGKPEKSATEFVGSNVRDVNGRICAAIQVISDMDGFSYDAYNGVIKVDPKPGMDMVYLQPDERVFEIYRSGFSPLKVILSEYGIYLREREVWLLRVVGDKPVTSIPVTILIEPEGATLEINGKEGGTGPVYQLSHGEHVFRISRPGYQSQEHRVQVDETNVFFRYILEEKPDVDVRITSTPPGATVFLENVELGSTPLAVFYPEGRVMLRMRKRLI